MRSFAEILEIAVARKGSEAAVLEGAPRPLPPEELAAIPDARWLAQMAKGIFQAGISWQVVEAKWEGITAAFHGFDPGRVSLMSEDEVEALLSDPRVIRSGPKILAIRDNATLIRSVPEGFGRRIADWPGQDFTGLLAWLATEGSRLGGTTGQYMLRFMGKDSFILTRDVLARLTEEGVIAGSAGSAKAMRAIQSAFSQWQAESGRSFNEISRVLARSTG